MALPPQIELVIARCGEDCSWLNNIPEAIVGTVYDKQSDRRYRGATLLPNVGREAHTYLHHLVERYDSLAPLTVFCQGKPFDHAFDFHQSLRELVRAPRSVGDFSWFGHLVDWDDVHGRRLFVPWSKNEDHRELKLGAFHEALFKQASPNLFSFRPGAQFVVTAKTVRLRSVAFYKHALALSETFPDAAHCFERVWDRVFGVEGIPPMWRQQTVYLKPVKPKEAGLTAAVSC